MALTLSHDHIAQEANKIAYYAEFRKTELGALLRRLAHKTIGNFSGNQGGKTAGFAKHYVDRVLGIHPLEEKNRLAKKIRCMSSSLPESDSPEEQDNTQYLELKKLIPPELVLRDVTARSKNLVVRRPVGLSSDKTVFEFRSSKQEMQDLGKIQLSSVWHDEETPRGHRDECKMRLFAESGDELFSLTPTNALCFDEETELLTKGGWKRFNAVTIGDSIMTHNIHKDCIEWKAMSAWHVYAYDGDMLSMKNGSFDFLVTPNHKWVVCNDRRKNEVYLEEAQKLNTKHIIKRISPRENNGWTTQDNNRYDDNFIALIGWIVSDGTVGHSLSIYQSKTAYPEKCAAICELVKPHTNEVRYEERVYGNTIIDGKEWIGSGIMCRWSFVYDIRRQLLSVLNGKSIDQGFICSLSKRQLEILFNAIVDGDGYRAESGGIRLNQTGNENLIDDFQLIATLLGRLSHKGRWVNCKGKVIDGINVYANSERFWPNTHVKSLEIKRVPYQGYVWCPTSENGTVVVRRNGCVSISGNSYTFDEVWQRADFIYRTKTIVEKFGLPRTEFRGNGSGIACIQMATDDNPTLDIDTINRLFEDITDPDELAIRRYGVFKQVAGRIHKSYDPSICYIDYNKYFPDSIPYKWLHARGIDYHESRIPWSIGWLSASPEDEWFLWQEFHPAIDGPNSYSSYDIATAMLRKSADYYYTINLIDPLANKSQSNTNTSVTSDLNRYFQQIRRETGLGTDAMWQGWDTKGTRGRDEVAKRFKNAVRCGKPFNNAVKERGTTRRLPTLWVCNTCPQTNKSLINWRFGEHILAATKATNNPKMAPQAKWSHDCMVLEALAKDRRLLNAASLIHNPPRQAIHQHRSITGR